MTLNSSYAFHTLKLCFWSDATTQLWNLNVNLPASGKNVAQDSIVFGNIRFIMVIRWFSGAVDNGDFRFCWSLYLPNLHRQNALRMYIVRTQVKYTSEYQLCYGTMIRNSEHRNFATSVNPQHNFVAGLLDGLKVKIKGVGWKIWRIYWDVHSCKRQTVFCMPVKAQVRTMAAETTISSSIMDFVNTSIPPDNTGVLNDSVGSVTSPCRGCDHVMTTFSVSNSPGLDDKNQSSLSRGEIQSPLSAGEPKIRCHDPVIYSWVRPYTIAFGFNITVTKAG